MNPPWPKDYVDIKKLAKAGFFYAFNEDNVHCAFCRGQVCRWDRDDDPMSEHARHFTTCPFIMGGDVGNEPLGEDPFPGPKRPRPYDVCGLYSNIPSRDSYSRIQAQRDYQQHPQNQSNNHHHHMFPHSYNHDDEHINSSSDDDVNHNSISSPSLDQQISESDSHNSSGSSYNLNGICKICYTNSIQLVFLPCGHSVSCLSCAQRLYNCPCCRATITTRIRTFLV